MECFRPLPGIGTNAPLMPSMAGCGAGEGAKPREEREHVNMTGLAL